MPFIFWGGTDGDGGLDPMQDENALTYEDESENPISLYL